MNPDAQVLKGILPMLLLRLLGEETDYGYAIVLRLRAMGFSDMAEGTVYPALARMERKGLLSSNLVPSSSGPARKYYQLTAEGIRELERSSEAWSVLRSKVDGIMARSDPDEEAELCDSKKGTR